MADALFRGSLKELDPAVFELTQIEAERQYRRLILIPSESTAPLAVREALGSAFQNIYAEGYPGEATRWMSEGEILDFDARLAHYRRYSDPRYYKGTEYVNAIEALARRRCAETFAANGISADDLYVNVQALSGGPANNAVYHALVEPGDTVMGMDLLHGGHLSHGSKVNRSGKYYDIQHYTVDPETEKIDYESIQELALKHKPKMIIGGFSSYPWAADWAALRAIADSVGAYLFADIAHVAGLIAAGVYPSPVGYADVITSTTHKSLLGPRGAIIMTHHKHLARKIDRAVFPGEQGGPHVNVFAGLAITFKLAQTKQFQSLQKQIIKNCKVFTNRLEERGFRIPFGGSNTHLMNLDVKSIVGPDDTALSGDMAARILDHAGIVVNRNTIPGDKGALNPSGIRMGTPWITQRGFKEKATIQLADIIADVLNACTPFRRSSRRRPKQRSVVDFNILEDAKLRVRDLAEAAGIDFEPTNHGYPHFYYIDDKSTNEGERVALDIRGKEVRRLMNTALSSDVEALSPDEVQASRLHTPQGEIDCTLRCISSNEFRISLPSEQFGLAAAWLRALSDGFIAIDEDITRKPPGPVSVRVSNEQPDEHIDVSPLDNSKPFYIGISKGSGKPLPAFEWKDTNDKDLKHTPLNETHRKLGAKMVPFAGWDMPVWYGSVIEEHKAVRESAGLFDVSHMGVYQAEGRQASTFLDSVCGNHIGGLGLGQSAYTHFLDPEANVIDDLLVYRRDKEKYLLVVNASNDDKDWIWLNGVKDGVVRIDSAHPWAKAFGREVILRNLRDPAVGDEMRVDIALQGPHSRDILLSLKTSKETQDRIMQLKRTELCEAKIGGFDLVVSRTGYTGEKMAFELFVHPEQSVALWNSLLKDGEPLGIRPCGLGARDSLRTEAGLPLYGQEMGGELNLGVAEAGFGYYVKTHKPWFIGRDAFIKREAERKSVVVRFRFNEKGVRMAHLGDPVVDKRGRVIGQVTSCAIDSQGLLTGQAFIDLKHAKKDTPIFIFQSASDKPERALSELKLGERISIPTAASVVSRFLKT
ncbi:MAG: glycine cleavage system aminomethyltransferase GcvT [Chloroflexi bacterium]|nr:glycine cleavage system aminomethyltransferase GcvT [Chloroflexota bacterium]